VPTAEADFVDAEAHILSSPRADASAEARGLNRMMSMVNGSRLGVATMGLGIMRRAFIEGAIYASQRTAFGKPLHELPLVCGTLVRMAVEVEAVSSVVFEASSLAGSSDRPRRSITTKPRSCLRSSATAYGCSPTPSAVAASRRVISR